MLTGNDKSKRHREGAKHTHKMKKEKWADHERLTAKKARKFMK